MIDIDHKIRGVCKKSNIYTFLSVEKEVKKAKNTVSVIREWVYIYLERREILIIKNILTIF